jgi:FkbM family methyltransferase
MTLRQRFKHWLYGTCPGFRGAFTYFGTRVYFPPGADIFLAVCQQGVFEKDIVSLLTSLAKPGTVFFDVGGNIGLMAIPVLRDCANCRVVSFEPSPNSLPFLQRTARESGYDARWRVVAKALSQKPDELDFVIGDARTTLYEGFKSGGRLDNKHTIKVTVSTLDEEWRQLGKPSVSVIKIDVEGAELDVLEGGRECLEKSRCAILIEWNADNLRAYGRSVDSILPIMDQLKYRMFAVPSYTEIHDATELGLQVMRTENFVLLPRN